MRCKHIAALITFFATFALSAFIALLFSPPKIPYIPPVKTYEFKTRNYRLGENIKEFLELDKRHGDVLDLYRLSYEDGFVTRESLARFADSVSEYSAASSNLDDKRFPREFRDAWREHMRAWAEYAEFLQSSTNKSLTAKDFNSRADRYVDDISRTWSEVLRVGREYGADLPSGF